MHCSIDVDMPMRCVWFVCICSKWQLSAGAGSTLKSFITNSGSPFWDCLWFFVLLSRFDVFINCYVGPFPSDSNHGDQRENQIAGRVPKGQPVRKGNQWLSTSIIEVRRRNGRGCYWHHFQGNQSPDLQYSSRCSLLQFECIFCHRNWMKLRRNMNNLWPKRIRNWLKSINHQRRPSFGRNSVRKFSRMILTLWRNWSG